ncbi:MAG: DEAD/DEAH box helicase family protein [Nitrospirota bacterium]|nr:DEAD/DEAH box helicase family protein [Nitrospirota bacterium]
MTVRPWTAALRDWQTRAVTDVLAQTRMDYLVTATPAAGKTRFALRIAHQYLADRAASRVLVICPTNHLRTQWASAAGQVGIQLDPALSNEQVCEARDYHGAVVTYQQVCLAPEVFRRACRSRKTLIVLDELHHAGDGKDWGKALREAFGEAVFRLALSGTPFRSDNNPIPYVRYEQGESQADFTYAYSHSIKDGVCRPILFPSYEGELTWLSDGREHRATFEDGLTFERQRERLKTALLQETWLEPVLRDAHTELQRLRKQEQADAGGLIVTMNQDHARQVAELVTKITGTRAQVAVSDDPSASKTIETFARHKTQQWLVAVNMVSEGVDIPRLRVGVYATNVLTEMYFRQVVGRFVRMQDTVPKPQRAWLYLPKDATLVHYAKRIKVERDHVLEDIMPAVQRTLFGTAATSLKEYLPLNGVARLDALIGADEGDQIGDGKGQGQAAVLHHQKDSLRDKHRSLVGTVARKTGIDHRQLNAELIKRTGGRVDQATIPQLERRIALLERWRDSGFDRKR